MIIDEFGLPRDQGSTDFCDSPRLAGLMVLVDHPKAPDLKAYIKTYAKLIYPDPFEVKLSGEYYTQYVRHPFTALSSEKETDPKNFSRDQLIVLTAGLHKLGYKIPKIGFFAQNGDLLISPSVRGHLKICAGGKANWWNKLWLALDIKYNAWRLQRWKDWKENYPVEQNQLIAMCFTYGPEWVIKYRESSDHWGWALKAYWSGWRNEPELCKMIIEKMRSV